MSRDLAQRVDRLVEGVVVDPEEPVGEKSPLGWRLGDDGAELIEQLRAFDPDTEVLLSQGRRMFALRCGSGSWTRQYL